MLIAYDCANPATFVPFGFTFAVTFGNQIPLHGCSTLIASPLPTPTGVIMWWRVMLANGLASQPAGRPHTLGWLATPTRNAELVATASSELTCQSLSGQTKSLASGGPAKGGGCPCNG
jgi:hypothetical protein